jgi:uncharacterized protein YjeT (DUF2065 family)
MLWNDFMRALALVMVIEGVLPFINPDGWRQAMAQAGRLSDNALRMIGLVSMLIGVVALYFLH